MQITDTVQSGDWKQEKHTPVIEIAGNIEKGKPINIKVSVGKEIPHPNKPEHHIAWIEVYFKPQAEKFPCQISRVEFSAHGASVRTSDAGSIFSEPKAEVFFKTEKPGTILALSYCNIHGLWQNSLEIKF